MSTNDPYGQQPQDQPANYGNAGQPYPQSGYAAGPYAQGGPAGPVPGKTMGIVGFVLSLLGPLTVVGLIVSIVAMVKSKRAHTKNGFALAGIIIGIIGTIGLIIGIIAFSIAIGNIMEVCAELGPGVHQQDGVTYTCG
ncbi:hypothetical protein [Arthrobacter castelli]|uniref:hypothetical protein n=1 Tax=Arthrobacter castelli TaxID=271431 RepID=UPI00041481DA|nr:hypothetical protein [Arthrobacter castelli]